MYYSLPYGSGEVGLDIDENGTFLLEAKPLPSPDLDRTFKEALENPVGTKRLSEIAKPGERVCIVVGDMTRLWARYDQILPYILEELHRAGIEDGNITIVSGTGAHRPQSEDEHRQIVGQEVYSRIKVVDHNCNNKKELVYLGKTGRGTPVWINKLVHESDRVILTGGVVHHFLAGYGGGKKSILPGVSGYETIMANHKLSIDPSGSGINPSVCAGRLKGNPLSEDMIEAARMTRVDFAVNVVINEEGRIGYVSCGDMVASHERSAAVVDEYFGVSIEDKSDLVIASCGGYPKDINLYQTYKTMYNARRAVRDGGVIIILSESREGIGNDNFKTIFTEHPTRREREEKLAKDYDIASFEGYSLSLWQEDVDFLVMSSIPEGELKQMGLIPIEDINQGLNYAYKKLGKNLRTYVMPHGSITFPMKGE